MSKATSGGKGGAQPEVVGLGRGGVGARRLLWLVLGTQLVLVLLVQSGRVYLDDEVGTWQVVSGSSGSILTTFDEWQTQPGYFLLAKLCALPLGVNELALRLPALVFGLLLTAAVFALVRRLAAGRGPAEDANATRAGLLAAALVGLHPFIVHYSQMARGYSMAMALVVVSLVCVHRLGRGEGGRWTGVVCALARAGSVYAHLGTCATIVAEAALAFSASRASRPEERRRNLMRALAWIAGGGLLAIALCAPLFPGMLAFRGRWTGQGLGGFTLGFIPLVARTYGGGHIAGMVLLGILSLVGVGTLAARSSRRGGAAALLLGCAAMPGFYAALDTAHFPWAFARFLTPTLPLVLAAAGFGLHAMTQRLRGVAAAATLLVVAGVAYRDLPSIAFGPKDLHWPHVLDELADEGPRTLVLAPVRFHAAGPYLERLRDKGVLVMRVEKLPEFLARGGLGQLASRHLTILQDLVPVSGATSGFRVEKLGTTTRLDRAPMPGDERALLEALRSLAQAQVEFLAAREGMPISGHWVFWRLGVQHQHPYAATLSHGAANALLATTSGMLGDEAAAKAALARAHALRAAVPAPGEVVSAWRRTAVGSTQ